MKHLKIFLLLMIGLLSVGFQSCSSDDDEPTVNDIVGTWKLTEVSTDNGTSFTSWVLQTTTATFNENGTYSGRGYFGNGSGTWKQNGKTIITYVNGSEYIHYDVKELTPSTCTLVMSMKGSDATIWVKCVKTSGGTLGGQSAISKSELEKTNAFECNDDGDMIYLKFRNGIIYTKEITESGSVCNQDEITYTLSGDKITMEMGYQKTSGTIYKVTFNDGKTGIVMDFDGNYGIATWLSKTFKESSYNF